MKSLSQLAQKANKKILNNSSKTRQKVIRAEI